MIKKVDLSNEDIYNKFLELEISFDNVALVLLKQKVDSLSVMLNDKESSISNKSFLIYKTFIVFFLGFLCGSSMLFTYYTLGGIRMFSNELFQNMNMENNVNGDNNYINNDMNVDVNMMNYNNNAPMGGAPVNEGVQEKCVHRTFVHEVPHVCPIHTRIINHHVYKHTYRPQYTCSEENTVSNVQ